MKINGGAPGNFTSNFNLDPMNKPLPGPGAGLQNNKQ